MSRRTILVASAASVVLLALWFLLLWGPQGDELEGARERRAAAEAENTALELRLARLRAAQEQAPQLMADLDDLRRAVPDDPQLAEFIFDANEAATEAGVDFISIAPGVPSLVAPLPPTITLNISVLGEYFSVLDYLERLDDLPRIVVIDSLGLTPIESDSGQEDLRVEITARMFATSAPQLGGPPVPAEATTTTTTVAGGESQQQVTTSTSSTPDITVSGSSGG